MARRNRGEKEGERPVISIIGPGMHLVGDCVTEGTVRVEGTIKGRVFAGKAVVVGEEGVVDGDVFTEDAVVSGTVTGTLLAASRLEVTATSRIRGEVRTRRLLLEEGAVLNGDVHMGETQLGPPPELRGAHSDDGIEVVDSDMKDEATEPEEVFEEVPAHG